MKDNRMDNIVECAYNMDNGYVEVWFTDALEQKPEKMYLRIPANMQNMEKQERQKRSIHERLEEKKQIVEQQTKKKQRSGMEL